MRYVRRCFPSAEMLPRRAWTVMGQHLCNASLTVKAVYSMAVARTSADNYYRCWR